MPLWVIGLAFAVVGSAVGGSDLCFVNWNGVAIVCTCTAAMAWMDV